MKRTIATCLLLAATVSFAGCITEEEREPTEECTGWIDFNCESDEDDDEPPTDEDDGEDDLGDIFR